MKKLLLALSVLLATQAYALKSSSVSFKAKPTPNLFSIDGEGAHLTELTIKHAKHGNISGTATASLVGLTTGMDLRDEHMHDNHLETKKYPEAKLTFNGVAGRFKGYLTLKGVKNAVFGTYKIIGDKKLTAQFKVRIADYPLGVPKYQAFTVADTVEVFVEAQL